MAANLVKFWSLILATVSVCLFVLSSFQALAKNRVILFSGMAAGALATITAVIGEVLHFDFYFTIFIFGWFLLTILFLLRVLKTENQN